MLMPEQVIPFLTHDLPRIRDHAVHYLGEAGCPAPATADDFWRVMDRFGMMRSADHASSAMAHLREMPQTDYSVMRALEELRSPSTPGTAAWLWETLASIEPPLLEKHAEAILAVAATNAGMRQRLETRLALRSRPPRELWGELTRLDKEESDGSGKAGRTLAASLILALSQHAESAAWAMDVMASPQERWWLEIWSAELLGRLRHRPAADLLIAALQKEGDVLSEVSIEALARLHHIDVLQKLEAAFPSQSWDCRIYMPQAFRGIKHPESEAALLRLLGQEQDRSITAFLAGALCDLCSRDAIEPIRRIVLERRYDPTVTDLKESLLIVAEMTGYTLPEANEWEQEIAQKEARRAERQAELKRLGEVLAARKAPPRPTLLPPQTRADVVSPIRRTEKAGRNDPCPCGSGKKHKKCCGR